MDSWKVDITKRFVLEQERNRSLYTSGHGIRIDRSVYIRVAEARKLKAMDFGGTSDPYCILQLGGQQVKTQTVWKTLSPLWGEEFNFSVNDPESDVLTITVFDEDKRSKDEPFGRVTFPIKTLPQEVQEQWYSLVPEEYKHFVSGDVHMKMKLVLTSYDEYSLHITIVEARNLAVKDSNGLSDVRREYTKYIGDCIGDSVVIL
jgi:Ca2+-dependent lipid-binding protein